MALRIVIILITIFVVAMSASTTSNRDAGKNESEFDNIWKTTIRQDEFDGIPLPEKNTGVVPIVTQATPAVMKIGYQYGIPYTQPLGKKKNKPGKKDDILEHMMGASLMSGGTLFSLGALVLVTMASKALLLAFGAILLTYLSSGWMSHRLKPGSASTVYEVIAKPQVSHSYTSEVRHEPYSPPPSSSTNEYPLYYGHR